MRRITSKVVFERSIDFFSLYGLPRVIQTVSVTNFTSKVFRSKCAELDIQYVTSVHYHPQSPGLVEMFYQTLKSVLKKHCYDYDSDSNKALPFAHFAIRNHSNSSAGVDFFKLMFYMMLQVGQIFLSHNVDVGNTFPVKQSPYWLKPVKWDLMASARKRTYQAEFLNYGFTEIEDKGQMKPQCVVCMKVLTAESFEKNQLKKHLDKVHSHLSSKPREYFENLEKTVKRQRLESNKSAMFDQRSAAIASFEVAWFAARNKKTHTIGEDLIKPAAVKMAEIMCGQKVAKQLNTVPLSARVIKERISILAENVREQMISSVKKVEFAIQLDETTDVSSNSQLMVYIRYRGSDEIEEEMLCSLEMRTHGFDVFNKVDACFKKPSVDLKWEDCIAVSVDGTPAMLGPINGFVALAKQQNPDILVIHCMIDRQVLVVKNLEPEVEAVLNDVVKIVNVVKGHELNTRMFRDLCEDGEAEYSTLLFHTEVRWLSRGNVLNRVWALKTELKMFLTDKKHTLAEKFRKTTWLALLAYLADIFGHVNELNKELQGKKVNLLLAREKNSAFVSKLKYWNQKLNANKTAVFPKLGEFLEDCQDCRLSDIKESVTRPLTKFRNRFCDYSPELDSHTVSWVVNPFKSELADLPEQPEGLAEEPIELRSSNETKMEFESKDDLSSFWMSKTAKAYKTALMEATKMLLPFATTSLCEQGFSTLFKSKNKIQKPVES
ncbi:protein FAM200C-like [Palaemon carinicauda]|uniref:protein FAM200C-like n=1 Tax=Palaemon carinicauda TaxID=392227 RepID=UPI0035B639B6